MADLLLNRHSMELSFPDVGLDVFGPWLCLHAALEEAMLRVRGGQFSSPVYLSELYI